MKVIEPYVEIQTPIVRTDILSEIEMIGRVCYKSENKIDSDSASNFVRMLIKRGHEAVIEHFSITVRIVCDRGVSHEIVRHRVASYAQESTRYCNYSKDKFSNSITFIKPCFWDEEIPEENEKLRAWENAMQVCENTYFDLIKKGALPQEARSVLPNSLKTEIIVTMNLRQWRHFLKLRTESASHPQMRQIAIPVLNEFRRLLPEFFEDILL